jgi:poly(A) polymerase Pap1
VPVKLVEMKYEKTNHLMQVLTPGSPYNSTERINDITFKVLISEFLRARELLERNDPRRIFDRVDFINEYPLFIEIDIYGDNSEPHYEREYNEFKGAVESKLVGLISKMGQCCKSELDADKIKIVPYPRTYKKNDERYAFDYCYFFGASVARDASVDLMKAVQIWAIDIIKTKKDRKYLGVRVFETKKS